MSPGGTRRTWGRCLTARSTTGRLPGKRAVGFSSTTSVPFTQDWRANPATYGPHGTLNALLCARGARSGGWHLLLAQPSCSHGSLPLQLQAPLSWRPEMVEHLPMDLSGSFLLVGGGTSLQD